MPSLHADAFLPIFSLRLQQPLELSMTSSILEKKKLRSQTLNELTGKLGITPKG